MCKDYVVCVCLMEFQKMVRNHVNFLLYKTQDTLVVCFFLFIFFYLISIANIEQDNFSIQSKILKITRQEKLQKSLQILCLFLTLTPDTQQIQTNIIYNKSSHL